MKRSLSSCSTSTFGLQRLSVLALVVVFLSLLLTSAATPVISSPTNIVPRNPSTNQEDKLLHYKVQEANHHPLHPQPCDHQSSVSQSSSAQLRSLCLQLHQHKIFHAYQPQTPPPPPPVALDHHDEIDPRYGVEKRLVPSGPNPLHN
ncbi:hypothetical protein ACE6H2_002953 [Prunus campanulata]